MPQLINVAKTDTFEEQRTKINNLAADVYNLQTQSGATAFVALTDTPITFTADKWIRVDSSGSSLEWFDGITKLSELTNDVGYLTSFTETDPTVPGHVKSITTQNIADWNEAHGWGDHSQAGYLTTDSDTTYTIDLIQSGNTPVADEFKLQLTAGGSGSGTDIISFKAGTGIEFEGLNANGSDVTIKSTGGGSGATTLAALTDTTIPGTITTGHVLKWDGTTWGPAPDSTSTSGSGIALTDISVVKPNPAASGNGDLTYNDVSGQFTFTPADVPFNLSQLNNDVGFITGYTETDPTVPSHVKGITAQQVTNWDEAHGWGDHSTEGYLKGIGSLSIGALSDVDTTGVANNKILKHNGTSWVIADDNAGSGGTTINSLGDINDVSINNVQGDQLLKWDGNNWINFTSGYLTSFTETDPTVPAHVKNISSANISNWNDAHGWGDHSTEGYLTTESDPTVPSHVKGITTGDINSWNAKSDVSALNDLSDVNTSGVGNGKILKHNGTSWVIGDDTTINTLNDIGDVNVGTTITDGYVLKWDNTNTQWVAAADSNTTSNTYVTYLNGQPRWSEQTAANNYQEVISYQTATNSGPGGVDLWALCDGNGGTYVNMGCGHADMSFLWLSQAALTDVVKITIGFDGHGWIGYGSNSGISTDSATLLRVDNGQTYGANGVTGSPTEIILYDNSTPIYSGQLQTLTFVEYPDANGTGGSNRGAGSRCHVYYFKITRSVDNVLTEITYTPTSAGGGGGISLSDLAVLKPNPTASGNGDLTYSSINGQFTYTPPDLSGIPNASKISQWDTAYGWGDHSTEGYLTSFTETDPTVPSHVKSITQANISTWNSALTSYTETDPVFVASAAYNINSSHITNWDTAYGWGDHSTEGYLTSYTETDPTVPSHVKNITAQDITNWNSAGSSGITLAEARQGLSINGTNGSATATGGISYDDTTGIFTYSPPDLSGIPNSSKTAQWDTAYGWGDHSAAGYLTSFTESDPTVPAHVKSITSTNISNWNSAYGWGDHSAAGYTSNSGTVTSVGLLGGTGVTVTNSPVTSSGNINIELDANLNDLNDVNVGTAQSRTQNTYLRWTGSQFDLASVSSGGGIALTDISVASPHPSASGNGDLSYNASNGEFTYTPANVPTNVSQLTNDSGFVTSESDPVFSSHAASNVTTTKISNWDTAHGWGDHSQQGYLTSASAPSGVPSGTIVMYNSGSAPSGWAVCDGSNGTPDLRGRFIVAAGGSYSGTGGSADAVVVSHSHGYSSFSSTGDHTHSVSQSSTNVSNQSNHTHPTGNYSVSNASGGSHSHSVDFDTDEGGSHTHHANISGTTDNQSANHTHTMDTSGSGFGGGGHAHTQDARYPGYDSEDSETGWGYSTSWSVGTKSFGGSSGNHSHSLTHATLGISENHTHSMNWNVLTSPPLTYSYHDHGLSGNTSSEGTGSHSHPFSGSSGGAGSHSHNITMSFTETSTGDHTHSFSIDSQGQSGSGKNLPPYYTLTYIMKL
tara:strand:- start:2320 stop:6795 length:4476 start_codon:yes stop_codon:yes gene_type:complete